MEHLHPPCALDLGGGGGGGDALSFVTVVGHPYTAKVMAEYHPLIIKPSVGILSSSGN